MTRLMLCFLLVVAAPATSALGSPVGTLAGHVKDQMGRPLAGVIVTITGTGAVGVYSATTDASGRYRLIGLPTLEPLHVTARFDGKVPVTYAGVQVREGAITRRDFRLRPAGEHDVLVIHDPRIPFHGAALEGVQTALPGPITVLELSGVPHQDARLLRETLPRRFNAVIAIGSGAARLARREVRDAPVVYTMVLDPAVEDLVRLNLCGMPLNGAFDEQVAVLSKLRPGTRRVATIYDPRRLAGPVGQLRQAAAARGMTLVSRTARNPGQLIEQLESLRSEPLDAFFFLLDPDLIDAGGFERVRRFAESRGLVFVVPDPSLVAVGGTFSYGPGFREMGEYAGRLVKHLFSGEAEPADIAVRFPTRRFFSINPFELERLGLRLPPGWTPAASSSGAGVPGPSRGID